MGKLILVPTPIGNLGDMTFRAVELLKTADLILAEDTRNTGRLLKHFEIDTKMRSYHAHNEHRSLEGSLEVIRQNSNTCLVSDAGTPGISDPGFLLARECIADGIEVECLPGPTALIPALVQSGLPCDRFYFEGFLPQKKGRQTRLEYISKLDQTVVLYESPHRIAKAIGQLMDHFGPDRPAAIVREISKLHEESMRGTLSELNEQLEDRKLKGEIVVVVGPLIIKKKKVDYSEMP